MGNMDLWTRVAKTNPAHTTKVNQRGGFTSICAHSQIEAATREFGPVGVGWGYNVRHDVIQAGNQLLAVADVVIWHGSRENTFGPWRGMSPVLGEKGRLDDDAAKKAQTDALTKGLSHLGFNADVFLGLYDDNKYVAKVAKEFAQQEQTEQAASLARAAVERFFTIPSLELLKKEFADHWKAAKSLGDEALLTELKHAYDTRKEELEQSQSEDVPQ